MIRGLKHAFVQGRPSFPLRTYALRGSSDPFILALDAWWTKGVT